MIVEININFHFICMFRYDKYTTTKGNFDVHNYIKLNILFIFRRYCPPRIMGTLIIFFHSFFSRVSIHLLVLILFRRPSTSSTLRKLSFSFSPLSPVRFSCKGRECKKESELILSRYITQPSGLVTSKLLDLGTISIFF